MNLNMRRSFAGRFLILVLICACSVPSLRAGARVLGGDPRRTVAAGGPGSSAIIAETPQPQSIARAQLRRGVFHSRLPHTALAQTPLPGPQIPLVDLLDPAQETRLSSALRISFSGRGPPSHDALL